MLRKFLILLLFILPIASAAPSISEVMPNPLNESNEWAEIYSAETINLSEWFVGDQNSNDTIICTNCMASGYFLIIGNSASIASINPSAAYFVTDDSKIGNGLSNTADCVNFFSGSYSTGFCWSSTTEESSWTLLSNSSWVQCENSTPGSQNACQIIEVEEPQPQQEESQQQEQQSTPPPEKEENVILKANFAEEASAGQTYENLFKVVVSDKEDCADKDDVKVSFNVSGEGTFYTSSFEREVGCSGYAGTGFWTPESGGSYVICGVITETSAGNELTADDSVCWRINVREEAQEQEPAVEEKDEEVAEKIELPSTAAATQAEEKPAAENAIAEEKPKRDIVVTFSAAFAAIAQILYKLGLIIR